jgi:hypothetical protein
MLSYQNSVHLNSKQAYVFAVFKTQDEQAEHKFRLLTANPNLLEKSLFSDYFYFNYHFYPERGFGGL